MKKIILNIIIAIALIGITSIIWNIPKIKYVYRMWGGAVAIEDIATAMEEVSRKI